MKTWGIRMGQGITVKDARNNWITTGDDPANRLDNCSAILFTARDPLPYVGLYHYPSAAVGVSVEQREIITDMIAEIGASTVTAFPGPSTVESGYDRLVSFLKELPDVAYKESKGGSGSGGVFIAFDRDMGEVLTFRTNIQAWIVKGPVIFSPQEYPDGVKLFPRQ